MISVSVRNVACYLVAWWLTGLGAVNAGEGQARDSHAPGHAAVTVAIVPSLKATAPQEMAAAVVACGRSTSYRTGERWSTAQW